MTPSVLQEGFPSRYQIEEFVIETQGEVQRRGRNLTFTATGNNLRYQLARRPVEEGREAEAEAPLNAILEALETEITTFVIRGRVHESRNQLVLEVHSATPVESDDEAGEGE